jgi:hypothetical protein
MKACYEGKNRRKRERGMNRGHRARENSMLPYPTQLYGEETPCYNASLYHR